MKERERNHILLDYYNWLEDGPCPPGTLLARLRPLLYERGNQSIQVWVAGLSEDNQKALFEEWVRTLSPERQKYIREGG